MEVVVLSKLSWIAIIGLTVVSTAQAQAPPAGVRANDGSGDEWRTAGNRAPAASSRTADRRDEALEPLRPIEGGPRSNIARVTKGSGTLPNDHGQVWREYDISPYTLRVTSTQRPEQAVIDWILRETGYEAWHSEPLGILSATVDGRTLRVYHTPEMHAVVAEMVDRFVNTEAETQAYGIRVVTIGNPNWRAKAQPILHPVPVQTQGAQAWLMAKEDAGLLLAEMRKRTDFREHSSPHLMVNNGQASVVSATRPRPYMRDIILRPDAWPGFESQAGQIDEGYSLELSPLLSLDGKTIDAVLKCNIDQVEKVIPVMIDVPVSNGTRQRARLEVPQTTQWRLHERFRWPSDQVLLVGMGVVATPVPSDPNQGVFPLQVGPPRADLLVFIESRGATSTPATTVTRTGQRDPGTYRNRY